MNHISGVSLFVRVAQAGSFVEAARQEGVSPSAVSKSITRLEQRLGVKLVHRSTRSLSLTAEGRIYLESCLQVLSQLQTVESSLGNAIEQPQGRLRISLPMVCGFLLPALADFSSRYSAVVIDIEFSDRLVEVIAEGFDLVIRTGSLSDSRLSARPLERFKAKVVGSPGYFLRNGTPMQPADLQQHHCLHYRFSHSGKIEPWRFHPDIVMGEAQLPPVMICNSLEARIHYAKQGSGLAWVPDFSVRTELGDGSLLSVLDDCVAHADEFSMVWPSGKQTTPKLRAFIDFMSARVQ
ncbi:LysR family transcriptional regulator [Pseudomonas helleri]|uniref:LysR family transcriptional regulator n=1 Tax=Pseudomonas helleri TaxID=1608996 RepID=UPI0038233076